MTPEECGLLRKLGAPALSARSWPRSRTPCCPPPPPHWVEGYFVAKMKRETWRAQLRPHRPDHLATASELLELSPLEGLPPPLGEPMQQLGPAGGTRAAGGPFKGNQLDAQLRVSIRLNPPHSVCICIYTILIQICLCVCPSTT